MSNAIQIQTDEHNFAMAQRQAKALAASDLVPAQFKGNMPNVLIAMDMANRLGASPMMVMQNLHIIHGRPGWSSQFLIATLNKSGKFTPLRYETRGDDPHAKDYRVRAVATDRETGELCEGPWVTWRLVEGEGWSKKNGSKWLTMPDVMFRYRSAAFWIRLYSPETAMGIHTADEVADFAGDDVRQQQRHANAGPSKVNALLAAKREPVEAEVVEPEVEDDLPGFDDQPAFGGDGGTGDQPDYLSMGIRDLVASIAGRFDAEFDAVFYAAAEQTGAKATTVEKLSVEDAARVRAWCLNELGVSE